MATLYWILASFLQSSVALAYLIHCIQLTFLSFPDMSISLFKDGIVTSIGQKYSHSNIVNLGQDTFISCAYEVSVVSVWTPKSQHFLIMKQLCEAPHAGSSLYRDTEGALYESSVAYYL